MIAAELKAKYSIGNRTMTGTLGCGHKVFGLTGHGIQDRTRDFRAEAKQVACNDCGAVEVSLNTPDSAHNGDPATSKQLQYARRLIRQHEGQYTAHGLLVAPKLLIGISKSECSQLIDVLLTNS